MNKDTQGAYKELLSVYNRCNEDCEHCDDYDDAEDTCKWELAIGSYPPNWTLGRLRMNDKELEIMRAFDANVVRRDGERFLLYKVDILHAVISFPGGSTLFDWLEAGESETI